MEIPTAGQAGQYGEDLYRQYLQWQGERIREATGQATSDSSGRLNPGKYFPPTTIPAGSLDGIKESVEGAARNALVSAQLNAVKMLVLTNKAMAAVAEGGTPENPSPASKTFSYLLDTLTNPQNHVGEDVSKRIGELSGNDAEVLEKVFAAFEFTQKLADARNAVTNAQTGLARSVEIVKKLGPTGLQDIARDLEADLVAIGFGAYLPPILRADSVNGIA